MKVLWFEVTVPNLYHNDGRVLGGWQDSLERIVRTIPNIELSIAFEDNSNQGKKIIDGVKYIPINLKYSEIEKRTIQKEWEIKAEKLLPVINKIVEDEKPDLIHVFGTEWAFGLIAELTNIPVVIHIQGSIPFFNNMMYPPCYSIYDEIRDLGWKALWQWRGVLNSYKRELSREKVERRVWNAVNYYMGRTEWDKGFSAIMHPQRRYYHVDEALRPIFVLGTNKWNGINGGKLRLFSTGCISFRKGPDLMLKTANILKTLMIDFEWTIAGEISSNIRRIVERKEGLTFDYCNIRFLGYVSEEIVMEYLCDSTIFVHTAYAENSPNSICEAQCVGIPVVCTNTGGVSSLVRNNVDGIVVPMNDPWTMAYQIISLYNDENKLQTISQNSRKKALERHADDNIKKQLLYCYKDILKK